MPDGRIMAAAALAAIVFFGGQKVVKETNQHVVKPIYHHVLKPIGCHTKFITTLGHKHCK